MTKVVIDTDVLSVLLEESSATPERVKTAQAWVAHLQGATLYVVTPVLAELAVRQQVTAGVLLGKIVAALRGGQVRVQDLNTAAAVAAGVAALNRPEAVSPRPCVKFDFLIGAMAQHLEANILLTGDTVDHGKVRAALTAQYKVEDAWSPVPGQQTLPGIPVAELVKQKP